MKSFLKKILPVAVMAFLRKIVLKNQSRRGKRFTDGTVYYGMQSENYEPHIMKLLRELSLTHNTFVNFGANTGYYPTMLASNFENILAVEALSENYSILKRNIYENNLSTKVICLPLAVGKDAGLATFYGGSTGGSLVKGWNDQMSINEVVQIVKGDTLYSSFINDQNGSLFLIDCEASELQVLQGLNNTILNTKSTFLVEIPCREFMPKNEFNPAFRDIFKLMFESGYGARLCRDDGSFYELSLEIIEGFINENRYEGMMVLFEKALTNTDLTENG